MKHLIITLGLCYSLCGVLSVNAQQKAKRFTVKSGHIEYKLSGNTVGTKSIWFDNYGDLFYQEEQSKTTTKMFGITNVEETHTIYVQSGETFYSANLKEGSGTNGKLPYYQTSQEFANGLSEAEAKKLENDVLNAFGGERLGNETVLGKTCEVISVMGGKTWLYKGIVLKSEVKVMGIANNEEAVSLETNIKIPASKFNAPDGIDYQDLQAMQAAYYQEMGASYEEEPESNDDEEEIPVTYDYNKFLQATSSLSYPGYAKTTSMNMQSKYITMYLSGLTKSISVVASSLKSKPSDSEIQEEMPGVEQIKCNGHKAWFGQSADEDRGESAYMNIIMIEYPEHDLMISLVSSPKLAKAEMLKLAQQLKF